MSLEGQLCQVMGAEYAVLFPKARTAISHLLEVCDGADISLPTNICPELLAACHPRKVKLVTVDPINGLVPGISVHLYGYRNAQRPEWTLEIDPLMTGAVSAPVRFSTIISFGHSKTIDIGGGGAFLTNDKSLSENMWARAYFPAILRKPLGEKLYHFNEVRSRRREKIALWDRHLGDSCIRIPGEQIIPWRVMRRIPKKRDAVVKALREAGFDAGTNYPPLPGVTDPGAIQWGKEVINFFVSDDYDEPRVKAACEIIKRTIGQ